MEKSLSSHPCFPCPCLLANPLSPKKGLLRKMKSTFTASKGKGGINGMLLNLFDLGMSLIQLVNPC